MTDSQKWLVLAGVFATGWLLHLLAPVLTPFLISALLSYLGDPVVDRLERLKISRTWSVVTVFVLMILAGLAVVLVLLPVLERQIEILLDKVPTAIQWLQQTAVPRLVAILGIATPEIEIDSLRRAIAANWQEIGGAMRNVLGMLSQSGQMVVGWLVYILLIPVVTFYLLRDWDHLLAHIQKLLPRRIESITVTLARECDAVLAQFLRGQLTVMVTLGAIYAFGLWVGGLELAFLIGMLAGLVSFVPYLGFIVGFSVAGFAAVMEFYDFIHLVYVGIVFGIGQAIEGMVLSPWLVGERIGLHPVAVIFAVMAGGQLFGFFGVLLALPVAAVIVVLLRHSRDFYLGSGLYSR